MFIIINNHLQQIQGVIGILSVLLGKKKRFAAADSDPQFQPVLRE